MNNLKFFSSLLIVALLLSARAQTPDPDDQYMRVFDLIQQADTLNANGKAELALSKYRQAHKSLLDLKKTNPDWNTTAVAFRLNYLTEKITALSGNVSTSTPSSESAAGSSMPQVKLLEAGAEPRRVLRLHPKPGDKESVVMGMKMAMEMKIGDMENPPMKMPLMKMTMDSTIKSVLPNGDVNWEMVISDVSVADDADAAQAAAAMKAALAGIKGLSGAGIMSNRGFNKGMNVKLPADANPQLRQMMDQWKDTFSRMAAPLPEEPIGLGGKWQARMPVKSQGMTLDQMTTYQLLSLEEDRLLTTNTVVQTASNQKIQNPAMPSLKLDLTKMTATGGGNVTYDLTKIVPPEASVDYHSELSMSMNMGGQKQNMEMKIELNLQLAPK